jgi:cytoskeleton protein RodZ
MDIGTELRQAREARGLSLAALAAATRIPPRALEGIERNDLSAIPPRPYARGFVATYAREVGLDPQQIVREYFAQFDTAPSPSPRGEPPAGAPSGEPASPRWTGAGAVAAVATLALILIWATPLSRPEPGAVGTSGTTPAVVDGGADHPLVAAGPDAAPASGRATPDRARASAAARPETAGRSHTATPGATTARGTRVTSGGPGGVTVVLDTEHPAWIAATVDGVRVLHRTLPAGARETLQGSRDVTIRVGDAGAVRWSVNGRATEPMGRRGQVRTVTVQADPAAAPR